MATDWRRLPQAARVRRAWAIEDLRRIAKRRLPRAVFDFPDGGAEDELTLRENRAAFARHRFLPRVLVDVARIDTTTQGLGGITQMPIAIAPTGAVGFGWRRGDTAIARAAAANGIPYSLADASSMAAFGAVPMWSRRSHSVQRRC